MTWHFATGRVLSGSWRERYVILLRKQLETHKIKWKSVADVYLEPRACGVEQHMEWDVASGRGLVKRWPESEKRWNNKCNLTNIVNINMRLWLQGVIR